MCQALCLDFTDILLFKSYNNTAGYYPAFHFNIWGLGLREDSNQPNVTLLVDGEARKQSQVCLPPKFAPFMGLFMSFFTFSRSYCWLLVWEIKRGQEAGCSLLPRWSIASAWQRLYFVPTHIALGVAPRPARGGSVFPLWTLWFFNFMSLFFRSLRYLFPKKEQKEMTYIRFYLHYAKHTTCYTDLFRFKLNE